MNYWEYEIDSLGVIYSCDMLRISFELCHDSVNPLNVYLENGLRSDITSYPKDFRDFKYRHMYVIDYGQSTMTIGLVFNGVSKEDNYKCFLEFNPNKCMDNAQCEKDLGWILSCSSVHSVSRWDLAIDLPHPRELVHMKKDNRKFELHQNGFPDRTEYLGQRNKPGRVKMYNKQLESGLDYPLTRFEITMGTLNDASLQLDMYTPYIWIDRAQQEIQDLSLLDSTQRVLVALLKNSDNPEWYMQQLGYRVRKKIEPYVVGTNTQFIPSSKSVMNIVTKIKELVNEK